MKKMLICRWSLQILILASFLTPASAFVERERRQDPLPSWNEGPVKHQVISFVEGVTDPSSKQFVNPEDRVATLDLDGTLMCEHPVNFQRSIAVKHLRELVASDPSLNAKQPFKAAWENDAAYYNAQPNHSFVFLSAFDNHTQEYYYDYVKDFLKTQPSEFWGVTFDQLFYVPALELVRYLENNDFEVYICSTTEEVCIKVLLKKVLGLHPIKVIGNEVAMSFVENGDEISFLMSGDFKNPECRREGKCLYLTNHIGKAPIFAFGNSMGDRAMLKYASSSKLPHFAMILDHDDPERELEYHENDFLDNARRNGWAIISMKNDFKSVFPHERQQKRLSTCE